MNRAEYMKELAFLVQDVPDEEREEALQYYEDYFDDAGPENEEQVIAELGRPEKLAAIIREGARTGYESPDAEYTENGYQNERFRGPQYEIVPPDQVKRKQLGDGRDSGYTSGPYEWDADAGSGNDAGKRRDPDEDTWKDRARSVFEELGQRASEGAREGRRLVEEFNRKRKKEREEAEDQAFRNKAGEETGPEHEETGPDREESGQGEQTAKDAEWFYEKDRSDRQHGSSNAPARRRRSPFLWILAAFGLLFLFPFLIGAIAIMFGLSVAVICLVGGIALAVVIVAVVFVVTGIILLGVGIGKLFLFPLAGMMFMSVGLILLGLGILAVWLTVLICGRLIPGTARMIVNFFSFFGRRRRGGAVS